MNEFTIEENLTGNAAYHTYEVLDKLLSICYFDSQAELQDEELFFFDHNPIPSMYEDYARDIDHSLYTLYTPELDIVE
jgi:hypothetical protein